MSDNLREKLGEKQLPFGAASHEPWPYLSFFPKNGLQSRVLKFVLIDDMPTIVVMNQEDGRQRVQWWGFWKEQWYTDFMLVEVSATVEQQEDTLKEATRVLLEMAEYLLLNDLHEPEDAVTPQEAAGDNGTA